MKKQPKIFYKVFIKDAMGLCSTSRALSHKAGINYSDYGKTTSRDGYITAPGNTRFFLFESKEDANKFIDRESLNSLNPREYVIRPVLVKGSYAKNCRGIKINYGGLLGTTDKIRANIREAFWNKFNYLVSKKKMTMAKACREATKNLDTPTLTCGNTPYSSIFARHIKILPETVS